MATKICKTCKAEKLETDFRPNRSVCKKCINDTLVAKRRPSNKLCKGCGVVKDITEFAPKKQLCKTCLPDPLSTGLKRCASCKIVQPVIAFHKQVTSIDGLANSCKKCAEVSHQTRKQQYDFSSICLEQTKMCSVCGETKLYTEFYAKVGSKGGVNSMCKVCCKDKIYEYRDHNPEVIKTTQRKSYYKDVVHTREKAKARRDAHPEAKLKMAIYVRAYRKINKEVVKEKDRARYLQNPTRYKYYRDKRKTKLKNTPGVYTDKDIAAIWEQQQGLCVYCGADLTSVQENIDHYLPLDLDGTNWPSNLQLLCETCNKQKWSKHPDVYEAQIGFDRTAWEAKFGRCLSVSKTIHK